MQTIKKSIFLDLINSEISKLPDYDSSIKIIDISVDANGLINYFLPNQFEINKVLIAREYVERVEHLFNYKYWLFGIRCGIFNW